jgi:hypothetical protein
MSYHNGNRCVICVMSPCTSTEERCTHSMHPCSPYLIQCCYVRPRCVFGMCSKKLIIKTCLAFHRSRGGGADDDACCARCAAHLVFRGCVGQHRSQHKGRAWARIQVAVRLLWCEGRTRSPCHALVMGAILLPNTHPSGLPGGSLGGPSWQLGSMHAL